MSDLESYSREEKKKELRKKVVQFPASPQKEQENSEEIIKESLKKRTRKRVIFGAAVFVFLAALIFVWTRYRYFYQYTGYEVAWETDMVEGTFAEYVPFGNNLLKYTRDGASYIDENGKTVWNQTYEIKTPIVSVNGDYVAIADQQGNDIYICDKNGNQGVITTLSPILKVCVSAHGVVAAILDDSKVNYINLYSKNGELLTDSMTYLENSGYPLDLSLSPDGTLLMMSYLYLDSGVMHGRVTFHNFSEAGKTYNDRLVAGFDKDYFDKSVIARVRILNENRAVAFADDALVFFNLDNVTSPAIIETYPMENEIQSIFYSSQYVGLLTVNTENSDPYALSVYDANGKKKMETTLDYEYTQAQFDGDSILLYNENSCRLYNLDGVEKFAGEFDFMVSKMRVGSSGSTMTVTGGQKMRGIRLQ